MKRPSLRFRQAASVLLMFVLTLIGAVRAQAQFINRGDVWVGMDNATMTPVQILPEDIASLQAYVLGHVTAPGFKDVSIIKGRIPGFANWRNTYHVEKRRTEAVKMLQYKESLFVLFNVIHGEYPTPLYAGIAELDANDGHVIQAKMLFTNKPGELDGPLYSATDLVRIKDKLIVSGFSDELLPNGYTHVQKGYLTSLDFSLNQTATVFLQHERGTDLMPLELSTDGRKLMVLSRFTMREISRIPPAAISVAIYDVSAGLVQVLEKSYRLPYRLRSAHIEYNKYNDELVLAFQQLAGPDFNWTFTLMSLETNSLSTMNKSVYATEILFNTDINIDEKYISLAGSYNVFDAGVYNGIAAQFYHDTHSESVMVNPYSTNTMGEDQAYFQDGSVSLLLTAMPDRMTWIYGYGPQEKCEIFERRRLPETDESYDEFAGMFPREDKIGNERMDLKQQDLRLEMRIDCGEETELGKRTANVSVSGTGATQLLVADEGRQLSVTYTDAVQQARVYDLSGRMVYQVQPDAARFIIPKDNMAAGVYVLSVLSGGKQMNQKFIVQ